MIVVLLGVVIAMLAAPPLRSNLTHLLLPNPSTLSDPPVISPSEVAARTSFTVLWPTCLPPSFVYVGGGAGTPGSHGAGTRIVKGTYASFDWQDHAGVSPIRFIHIVEVKGSRPLPIGQTVRLRGQVGVLAIARGESPIVGRTNPDVSLTWQEDGLTLAVVGSSVYETDVEQVAESLQPLNRPATVPYSDRVAQQVDGSRAVLGIPNDFPVPSVTHFADLKLYLVRTELGFVAVIDDNPRLHDPSAWNVSAQTFISPAGGEEYDWEGNCIGGPCPRGLDRYAEQIEDGQVVVDLSRRLSGSPVGDLPQGAPSPQSPLVP